MAQTLTPRQDSKKGTWGYVDGSDKWIVKPKYDSASAFRTLPNGKSAAYVTEKDKSGYLTPDGKPMGAGIIFSSIDSISPDIAIVKVKDKYGITDWDFNYILKPEFTNINTSSQSWFKVHKGDKTGYFDVKSTSLFLEPKYSDVQELVYVEALPLIPISNNGKWGLITRDGEMVLNMNYDKIIPYPPLDICIVSEPGKGNFIYFPKEDAFLGFTPNNMSNKEGFTIIDGIVVKPEGKKALELNLYARHFPSGTLSAVINQEGKIISQYSIPDVKRISGTDFVMVATGKDEYSVYNTTDNKCIASGISGTPKIMGDLIMFNDNAIYKGNKCPVRHESDLTLISVPGKNGSSYWHVVDENSVSSQGYEDVAQLVKSLFNVKLDGKWGLYNGEKMIIPAVADKKFEIETRNKLLIGTVGGKKGAYDFDGNIVLPHEYEEIMNVDNDSYFAAKKDGKTGLFGMNGTIVIPASEYVNFTLYPDFIIGYKDNKLFQILDYSGNLKSPDTFEDYNGIENLDGYYWLKKGNKWGVMNFDGNIIMPVKYSDEDLSQNGSLFIVKNSAGNKTYYNLDGSLNPAKRSIDVERQYLEHNIYNNGNKGFKIHYDFVSNFINNNGEEIFVQALVYKKNGQPARKSNGEQIKHTLWKRPNYISTRFSDNWIFFPYSQFVQGKGTQDYYIILKFQDEDNRALPTTGNHKIDFQLTR